MKLTNLEEIYQVESLNNPVRDLRVERRKSSIVNFVAEAMRNGERVLVHLEKGAIDVAEKTILQDNANQRNSQQESTCNIIREQDLPANTTISDDGHVLTMYNETQLQSLGKCNLRFINVKNGKKYRTEFVVVTSGTPLLGAKAAQVMKLLEVQHQNIALVEDDRKTTEEIKQPDIADQKLPTTEMKKVSGTSLKATKGLTMDKVLEENRDLFQGEGRFEGKVHLEIDEMVKPVKQPLKKYLWL